MEGEREGEKHKYEKETLIGCLLTESATQARALTGNRTSDLSLCGMMPYQLSRTLQGYTAAFKCPNFSRSLAPASSQGFRCSIIILCPYLAPSHPQVCRPPSVAPLLLSATSNLMFRLCPHSRQHPETGEMETRFIPLSHVTMLG